MRLALVALLALGAACSKQPGGDRAGGEPPAGIAMRPGMWESQMRIVAVEAPDAPPEIQNGLRAAISAAPVFERNCLTPAEAANPAAAFRDRTARENAGYACEPGESVFSGGRIRMTLTCRSTTGQPEMHQAMVGSYGAERFQVAVTGQTMTPATDMSPSYAVRISSTLTGRRVGDCPAGAAG